MNQEDHDEFLCRIAKTLYYGNTSSFDSVTLPLTELAAELYNEVKKENTLERLQVQEVAEINENACVSTCSLVLAILYLEKIKSTNPEYVEKVAPSELFLVSLLIASKFLNDEGEDDSVLNSEWAECSGMSLKTVNKIEKEFLDAIKWEVFVPEEQFWSRLLEMERYLANQEGKRRGWYSYTEFNILLTRCKLNILNEVLKYSALCVTCYAATVFSLIGTALLAIRLKHLLLNCILYVLVNKAVVTNDQCGGVESTLMTESKVEELNANETEVSEALTNELATGDIDGCNNATAYVCRNLNNSSSKIFSFKIKVFPHNKLLKYVYNDKSGTMYRSSLFHSRHGWPDF